MLCHLPCLFRILAKGYYGETDTRLMDNYKDAIYTNKADNTLY